ncbi:MAG: SDR family oxidoreductase [Pseudomonadota bacterium]
MPKVYRPVDSDQIILLGYLTLVEPANLVAKNTMYSKDAFQGKIVAVTGAGSGVGRALARLYSQAGASVAILDIEDERLAQTASDLTDEGANVLKIVGDVSDPNYCANAIDQVVNHCGGIDVLCNVAGIVSFRAIADVDPSFWRKHFAVNVDGPFFLSQAALPHLTKTGGNIVNVASSAALVGEAFLVPYAASKAALVHMTKSMAMELVNENVRINAVAPGAIDTNIMAGQTFPDNIDFDLVSRYTGLRAASSPEEIAEFIAYISSPMASSIHGACLSIDGGITAG